MSTSADHRLPPKAAFLAELAYGMVTAALRDQQAALDNLRTRAGTILTAASIVASFLGSQAIHRGPRRRSSGRSPTGCRRTTTETRR